MKIKFKDFTVDADNLRQFAKCICDQITIPDDLSECASEEIAYITEVAEEILTENLNAIYKNGEQLMRMSRSEVGSLLFYCATHGYERPEIHFYNESEWNEAGKSFCQILLLYVEVHYWDIQDEVREKRTFPTESKSAAGVDEFWTMERNIFLSEKTLNYICSPLRGKTKEETYQNMLAARQYMLAAYRLTGDRAIAPHAYLPVVMDDTIIEEREHALVVGKNLLTRCKNIFVCGDRISEGMKEEILEAVRLGKTIITFNHDVFESLRTDDTISCGGVLCLAVGQHELAEPATAAIVFK